MPPQAGRSPLNEVSHAGLNTKFNTMPNENKKYVDLLKDRMKSCSKSQNLAYLFAIEDIRTLGVEGWVKAPASDFTKSFEESLVDFTKSVRESLQEHEEVMNEIGVRFLDYDIMAKYMDMCAEVVKAVADYVDIKNEITVLYYSA